MTPVATKSGPPSGWQAAMFDSDWASSEFELYNRAVTSDIQRLSLSLSPGSADTTSAVD